MKNGLGILISIGFIGGCQKPDPSFDIASAEQSLLVAPEYSEEIQKLDILWVVDNSGSMATSQQRLTQNFPRFIQNFLKKRYDFRIAVTTTDAYRGQFSPSYLAKRKLRSTSQGESFLTPLTLDIESKFNQLAQVGTTGHGDERAFQSLEYVLTFSENANFRRPDAYLAIIIVSDEDDFSHPTSAFLDGQYQNPSLYPVSRYHDFLNQWVGDPKLYSVYAISLLDLACKNQLADTYNERKVAQRYHQLVELTGGKNFSLCQDFGTSLEFISDTIIRKRPPAATYTLIKEPVVESIRVFIDQQEIVYDGENGWSYNAQQNTLSLHGEAALRIQDGGAIKITFDPRNPFSN